MTFAGARLADTGVLSEDNIIDLRVVARKAAQEQRAEFFKLMQSICKATCSLSKNSETQPSLHVAPVEFTALLKGFRAANITDGRTYAVIKPLYLSSEEFKLPFCYSDRENRKVPIFFDSAVARATIDVVQAARTEGYKPEILNPEKVEQFCLSIFDPRLTEQPGRSIHFMVDLPEPQEHMPIAPLKALLERLQAKDCPKGPH